MQRAARILKEQLKLADIAIQVVDARSLRCSTSHEFSNLMPNSRTLILAAKADLAEKIDQSDPRLMLGIKSSKIVKERVLARIRQIADERFASRKLRGLVSPTVRVMVYGLPNVGKSTLINLLAGRKAASAADSPGVTRALESENDLLILQALRCISEAQVEHEDVARFTFEWVMKNHPVKISVHYGTKRTHDFDEFIDLLCTQRKYLLHEGRMDRERGIRQFVKDIQDGIIAKVNYDR
ncbi:unnamed protein product [Didymodactylos carnosus]|uniref:G domain-containing protein n=1 Tax=Didymodactylos carnosus TaxID=1234261 RepID=A0A8S2CRI8_9BILA|nr:unnamed protein product [Didymodactylos carnosus]CAF3496184.1 unnamed protein product [Didymodactylos carnosus]